MLNSIIIMVVVIAYAICIIKVSKPKKKRKPRNTQYKTVVEVRRPVPVEYKQDFAAPKCFIQISYEDMYHMFLSSRAFLTNKDIAYVRQNDFKQHAIGDILVNRGYLIRVADDYYFYDRYNMIAGEANVA